MNVWDNTTTGNRGFDKSIKFFVSPNCKLQMTWGNTFDLQKNCKCIQTMSSSSTFKSLEAFPASSRTSAVRYSTGELSKIIEVCMYSHLKWQLSKLQQLRLHGHQKQHDSEKINKLCQRSNFFNAFCF